MAYRNKSDYFTQYRSSFLNIKLNLQESDRIMIPISINDENWISWQNKYLEIREDQGRISNKISNLKDDHHSSTIVSLSPSASTHNNHYHRFSHYHHSKEHDDQVKRIVQMMISCKYKILSLSNYSHHGHACGDNNNSNNINGDTISMTTFHDSVKQSLINRLAYLVNDLRTLQYQRISHYRHRYNQSHGHGDDRDIILEGKTTFSSSLLAMKSPLSTASSPVSQHSHQHQKMATVSLEQYEYEENDNFEQKRDRELDIMLQGMQEIADTFQHLQQLTIEQGSLLARIDYNIEQTRKNVDKSKERIIRVNKMDSSALFWRQMVLLFLIVLIFMLGFMISRKR